MVRVNSDKPVHLFASQFVWVCRGVRHFDNSECLYLDLGCSFQVRLNLPGRRMPYEARQLAADQSSARRFIQVSEDPVGYPGSTRAAGELGVTLAQALEERGLVVAGEGKRLEVTAAGGRWFSQQFEMDTARLVPGRHGIARRCLDWTERRYHIAGPLGAALLNRFRELGWVTQAADSARAVKLSRRGAIALARTLDISL